MFVRIHQSAAKRRLKKVNYKRIFIPLVFFLMFTTLIRLGLRFCLIVFCAVFIDWKKMEMPPMMWIGNMCLSHTNHELFWNQKNLLNRLSN